MKNLHTLACVALLGACSTVHDETAEARLPELAANPGAGLQFERMKSLVGDWSVEESGGEMAPGTISYRLTAGGSALVETLFAGTDHEMLSVYHMDGDALVMTHYCVLQNAPTMRARASSDPETIAFECEGGANTAGCQAQHMHAGRLDLHGRDQVRSAWTLYDEGQALDEKVFTLRRK
jgi:hypothetical protein